MQCSIMENFKLEVEKTEASLRKMASENIINKQENTIEHVKTMKDIEVLSRVNKILEGVSAEEHKQEVKKLGENMLPLNSNFKNLHPIKVYINNTPHPAKYLRDIARIACAYLVQNHYDMLVTEAENFITIARNKYFASFKRDNLSCEDADEIPAKNGEIFYIDSCKMVVNQMGLLRRMLALVGVSETMFVVEVSETYLRKKREVKVPQRKSYIAASDVV